MTAIGEPLLHVAGNGDVTLTGSGLFLLVCVLLVLLAGMWR